MSARGFPKEQVLLLPTFWVLGRRGILGESLAQYLRGSIYTGKCGAYSRDPGGREQPAENTPNQTPRRNDCS